MKTYKVALVGCLAATVLLSSTIDYRATAAEPEPAGKGAYKDNDDKAGQAKNLFPETAAEYAKVVEPILGIPPKIDLADAVELPIYADGVQVHGQFDYHECDNPSRIGKGGPSGSVLQRYEGRTADGKPLPDVVWVAFGRNSSYTPEGGELRIFGSVQFIGYHKKTGATAFFESTDEIYHWASLDAKGERLVGKFPWIDDPEEFNKAFKPPGTVVCVECHQNDPYIHNSFIDAAKIPGTDETVVPSLSKEQPDAPYYVIGGENWDMRTLHIEGNACFDCHRIGMSTLTLFNHYWWDANEVMPPHDPGSLAEDYQELLAVWKKGPENVPGAEWVIPPARGKDRQIVGADYPYKMAFNTPGREASRGIMRAEDIAEDVAPRKNESPVEYGELLYQKRGCAMCHSLDGSNGAGPSFADTLGSRRELRSGESLMADTDYLIESIVNPRAKLVAGYTAPMPSYKNLLSEDDVFCLVEYLKTVPDLAPADGPASDASKSAKKTAHGGKKNKYAGEKPGHAGKGKEPVDLAVLGAKLKQAVQSGKLSEEDAMAKFEAAAKNGKEK